MLSVEKSATTIGSFLIETSVVVGFVLQPLLAHQPKRVAGRYRPSPCSVVIFVGQNAGRKTRSDCAI
jgi:hypothetical protein